MSSSNNTSNSPATSTATSSTSSSTTSSSSIFSIPEYTRLVTIAAHVDHGKTTLADNLIEQNGIISERLAGTIRYLDSDPEEQRRGITMRSSAIGLSHYYTPPSNTKQQQQQQQQRQKMIIHLVDSPGHTDFAHEVSNSMILCDSVLLVVDVVEGITPRTQQVFRETMSYSLTPILVLNKIDRLYTHLGLTSTEAYIRIRTLLETINAVTASMINSSYLLLLQHEQSSQEQEMLLKKKEQQEVLWTFDPAIGNVIFASAFYGWGFTILSICKSLYRTNTISNTIKPMQLKPFFFGDYKYNKVTQKIVKWKNDTNNTNSNTNIPLFAEYALQPIWDIYEGIAIAAASIGLSSTTTTSSTSNNNSINNAKNNNSSNNRIRADMIGMEQVYHALQIGCTNTSSAAATTTSTTTTMFTSINTIQDILTQTGAGGSEETTYRTILRRYRPLATCILDTICDKCPSPIIAQQQRTVLSPISSIESNNDIKDVDSGSNELSSTSNNNIYVRIHTAIQACSTDSTGPCVAHVCKFLSTDPLQIRDAELAMQIASRVASQTSTSSNSNNNILLGVTRVLSGRLQTGASYYVIGPTTMKKGTIPPPEQRIIRLYLLMGSSFLHVPEVPAGHLCAIYFGFDDIQYKTATISNDSQCLPIRGFDTNSTIRPLVKVSIEPVVTSDIEYLERGLTKLCLADASVEVTATDKGERLLACLGELHLEQSILDLERTYCGKEGIKLRVSDPIVDFAESTVWFDNHETDNFVAFYDDPSPILRQATIPPYNEEEGILFARNGRMRTVLSGKGAAISIRVVPLIPSVYSSLKTGTVTTDDSEYEKEMQLIGNALGYESLSVEDIHSELMNSLYVLNNTGSGMIGSTGIRDGSCVVGVMAEEVYVPSIHSIKNKSDYTNSINNSDDDETDGDGNKNFTESTIGIDGYEVLKDRIRNTCVNDSNNTTARLDADIAAYDIWTKAMKGSISAGFEIAMSAGPICEEPIRNVLVVVEGIEIAVTTNKITSTSNAAENKNEVVVVPYHASKVIAGGMVVSSIRSGIRCAFLSRPIRLMEGHLRLTLHSSLTGLGSLYHVLSKRRGKVIEDTMVDGTDLLMITALIPQAEAFGLTPELFAKTSGEVTAPEMIFSHWEQLDVNPFWIPTSEEEREDYGELLVAGDTSTGLDNTAVQYIRQVRKRKGLIVDTSRIVQNAEKQRTLKR